MLTVLETVIEHGPLQAADLARICGINRTVAHRLVTTLHLRGYVRRTAGGYIPGAKLFQIARQVGSNILELALPFMTELSMQVGETVVIHELDGGEAVVLGQAMSDEHVLRVQHKSGSRHSSARGASGLAILAFQPEASIARILDGDPAAEAVQKKLSAIRQNGYAISHDELQLGVHGLAVPLHTSHDQVDASLGLLLPMSRASGLEAHVGLLKRYAALIEASLQGHPQSAEPAAS